MEKYAMRNDLPKRIILINMIACAHDYDEAFSTGYCPDYSECIFFEQAIEYFGEQRAYKIFQNGNKRTQKKVKKIFEDFGKSFSEEEIRFANSFVKRHKEKGHILRISY